MWRTKSALLLLAFVVSTRPAALAAGACPSSPFSAEPVRPESVGLQKEKLDQLVAEAKAAQTDAMVIFKDGKVVAAFGEKQPIQLYSITKAITGLAAGRLFTEGRWKDLDAPLQSFFPDLKDDPKASVTLRQLMTHTSGIRDARDGNGKVTKEWNEAKDWLKAARELPMQEPAGTAYRYNNQGPVWVAAAVEQSTGERLDQFLARTVFAPLCIERFSWLRDKAGHTAGYTGLSLSAFDLAKIGQLILQRGKWGDQAILSEQWLMDSALAPATILGRPRGLLWASERSTQQNFPLPVSVGHTGDGGQYLIMLPNHGIVAVRLRKGQDGGPAAMDGFAQALVRYLIPAQGR
jgi:CubicO group peptidase (beta-lactamase class C family)